MGNFRGKIYKTLHLIIPYHMEMTVIIGCDEYSVWFTKEELLICFHIPTGLAKSVF